MNTLRRTCNARQGSVIEKLAPQNVPIWDWCNSKWSHRSGGQYALPLFQHGRKFKHAFPLPVISYSENHD